MWKYTVWQGKYRIELFSTIDTWKDVQCELIVCLRESFAVIYKHRTGVHSPCDRCNKKNIAFIKHRHTFPIAHGKNWSFNSRQKALITNTFTQNNRRATRKHVHSEQNELNKPITISRQVMSWRCGVSGTSWFDFVAQLPTYLNANRQAKQRT